MNANQPLGRLTELQYREAAFYTGDGRAGSVDVLRVHLRVPGGDYAHHDLPNGDWSIECPALQFMALWDYRPSDIGGRDEAMRDCEPDKTLVPISPAEDDWFLAQTAMEGGKDALENADWFDPDLDGVGNPNQHGPGGGGSSDPGTGNRGGVSIRGESSDEPRSSEDSNSVEIEKADEGSNSGVTVAVE